MQRRKRTNKEKNAEREKIEKGRKAF